MEELRDKMLKALASACLAAKQMEVLDPDTDAEQELKDAMQTAMLEADIDVEPEDE